MTIGELKALFIGQCVHAVGWEMPCHDCKQETVVHADKYGEDDIEITGGTVYKKGDRFYVKCDSCFKNNPMLDNYQECEVYSRVVGYLRPVRQWNNGKQAEFDKRKNYSLEGMTNGTTIE
jgi:hypothetical protein